MDALQYNHNQYQENENLKLLDESNEDLILRIAFAAGNFERLLKSIYSYDIFDRTQLQSILEDLGMDLFVKVPRQELTITRRRSNLMHMAIPKLED